MSPLAMVVGAASGLLGGWAVPALIARIPEPEAAERPDEALETAPDAGFDTGQDAGHHAGHDSGPKSAHRTGSTGAADSARASRPGLPPPPPKEPYAVIAAIPGLGWRAAAASAVAGGLLGWSLGWSWALLVWLPLVPIGVALAVVDWRTTLLPTRVIAPTYALVVTTTLVASVMEGDRDIVIHAAIGWAVMGGAFFLLWLLYPRGLGYGDVRLSGVLGIALGQLGWPELLTGLYTGFLFGGISGAVLAALRLVDRRRLPFGPFLLLGALAGVLAGPALGSWWRGLGY